MKANSNKIIFNFRNIKYTVEVLSEFSKLPYLFFIEFLPETPLEKDLIKKPEDGELIIRLDENLRIMNENPVSLEILELQETQF